MTNRISAKDSIPTDSQNLVQQNKNKTKSIILTHNQIASRIKGNVGKGPKTEVVINPQYKVPIWHQFNEEGKERMFKTLREKLEENIEKEFDIPEKDRTKLELAAYKFDVDYEDLEELYKHDGFELVVRFLEEEFELDESSLDNTILYEGTVVPFTKNPNYDANKTGGDSGGGTEAPSRLYKVIISNPKTGKAFHYTHSAEDRDEAIDIAKETHLGLGKKIPKNADFDVLRVRSVSKRQKRGGGLIDIPVLKTRDPAKTKRKPTGIARGVNYIRDTIIDIKTPRSQYKALNKKGPTGKSGEAGLNKRR